jgi:hypothetical protein
MSYQIVPRIGNSELEYSYAEWMKRRVPYLHLSFSDDVVVNVMDKLVLLSW